MYVCVIVCVCEIDGKERNTDTKRIVGPKGTTETRTHFFPLSVVWSTLVRSLSILLKAGDFETLLESVDLI